MPQIVGGNKIIFDQDDFLGCLSPQYVTSLTSTPILQIGSNLASARSFNPYRFIGYASPGLSALDVTNVAAVTSKVIDGCVGYESTTAYGYLISEGNLLYQLNLGTNTITNAGVWPHTIAAVGAETGSDVINYTIGGTRYIFYSYNDSGGAWDIGRYSLDGATFDDNWFTTVPAGVFVTTGNKQPIPMVVGSDDVLYIGNGNHLHAFDGNVTATGTVYEDVLVLPAGYRITSFSLTAQYLVVYAFFEGIPSSVTNSFTLSVAKAFFWNYVDSDPTNVYELNDNAVTAGFNFQGTIGCFTQGRQSIKDGTNRISRMKLFDGLRFTTIEQFIGNAPIKGGVDVSDTIVQWNSDGTLFQYGSPYEGLEVGLNKTGEGASTGTSANSGFCRTLDSTQSLLFSSGTGTSGGLQRFNANYADQASFSTACAAPEFPYGKVGKVKSVTVYYGKTCSGGRSLSLTLQDDITGVVQFTDTVTTITASDIVKKYEFDINAVNPPKFDVLRLIGSWGAGSANTDAPVVRKVVVEFEAVNIQN